MKKCEFEILPRQFGKTASFISLYNKLNHNLQHPINVVVPTHPCKRVYNDAGIDVFTIQEFIYNIRSNTRGRICKCSNLFLDEFFLYNETQQYILYDEYVKYVEDTVYIKTSPVRRYNKKLIDLCRYLKQISNLCLDYIDMDVEFHDTEKQNDFKYLYGSFLTDPNTTIYSYYDDFKNRLSEEQFKTQIFGQFFISEDTKTC
jgi:hypothetical protein